VNTASTWQRHTGESNAAHEAFRVYLDLGPNRSIRAVAAILGKHRTLIGRWSSRWDWVERARAYDRRVDRLRTRLQLRLVTREIMARHQDRVNRRDAVAAEWDAVREARRLRRSALSRTAVLQQARDGETGRWA
jgi:hypothetical protein